MNKPLRDSLIQLLLKGPLPKRVLIAQLTLDKEVTFQATYKVLSQLKRQGTCVEHNDIVGLSMVYIQNRLAEMEAARFLYETSPTYEQLFALPDKKKITVTAKTLGMFEAVWTHVDLLLLEQFGKQGSVPFLSFIPHDWFRLVREDSVNVWEKATEAHNVHMVCVTHSLPSDKKELARRRKLSPLLQYTHNENPLQQNTATYISVIGSYVLTATLDTKIAAGLEQALEPLDLAKLKSLTNIPGAFKLVIARDTAKADKLRKVAAKYFVFSTKS